MWKYTSLKGICSKAGGDVFCADQLLTITDENGNPCVMVNG